MVKGNAAHQWEFVPKVVPLGGCAALKFEFVRSNIGSIPILTSQYIFVDQRLGQQRSNVHNFYLNYIQPSVATATVKKDPPDHHSHA